MANINSKREELIIKYLFTNKTGSSSDIHAYLVLNREDVSLVTTKRDVSALKERGVLSEEGAGPATVYRLTVAGKITAPVDAKEYCNVVPDRRYGNTGYDFDLFRNIPANLFTREELAILEASSLIYRNRKSDISETIHKKELERFIIELSWKSSRIEGNTYTLMETERLIEKGLEAVGKAKEEAVMILNHKKAFSYIYENADKFKEISKGNIESVHRLLVDGLGVTFNLRSKAVGITGSRYRPLDNHFQIIEAVERLISATNLAASGYEKAIILLLGISYVQPFEDGNKRTARLMANSVLLSNDLAPLSYRSVDEDEYRQAVLVFYELNSVEPFKKIFIEQYKFSAENYSL
ncbi:MAG: Fic family protein [Candidatus Taylorbacteria bacterium]